MSKEDMPEHKSVTLRYEPLAEFEERARANARKADAGKPTEAGITVSFSDLDELLQVLTPARRRLIQMVQGGPISIDQVCLELGRSRAAVVRDVALLERGGLVVVRIADKPGHRWHKEVCPVARRIKVHIIFGK